MVKHIVLFKFKSFDSAEEKEQKVKFIQSQLLNLKSIIKEIVSIEVDMNGNPKEAFDLALISTHNSWDDLAVYDQHPDHVAVKKIIKEVLDVRSAADFEF